METSRVARRVDRIVATLPDIMKSVAMSRIHSGGRARHDLTFNQYQALRLIHGFQSCSVNQLAAGLRIAQSTTSQLVDRLVKAGLVARELHPKDRRRMVIALSRRGRSMMEMRTQSLRKSYLRLFSLLSDEDQSRLETAFVEFFEIAKKIEQKLQGTEKRP